MDRIFITGAKGMLGRALAPLLERGGGVLRCTDLPDTDIRDIKELSRQILDFSPSMVIHLASMTDVDGCEKDPDTAFSVNALGTRNVALACREARAVMVYVSTGSVYNGKKETPYTEYDEPDPISVYGLSKYHGEVYVRDLMDDFFIFYTCWLFGGGETDKKFIPKILNLARDNSSIEVVDDKFGSPTYTEDLAREIADFVKTGAYGRYHCANTGCVNRFELAREIIRIAGIKECEVIPVPSSRFGLPAPRPRMEALRNYNFELMGRKPLRSWNDALEEYIRSFL